ncbi:GDP-mannose-dependent alpha-(1-6)-phosphatidylinositol monomannoside mannosyltransferase [Methanobrevibacter cuticularis]|uniref:GDP-mannose-dependent alpha-(1-6)-phosphatidylinositol monomannoside mannosyltransferase n=1 Tax=Methanobrevibacter cuticularis TaxID=47311 RepID=A0A166CRG9_9EURY|nr:glycosyltransferase family 1 protein [Methanobrevibacter cuticularis]KZX14788.1 GDP-mannose-dependent alpha-(1-6)-phosphatidylinositol monomannoside mannosyltransferase [Methanobrevibacter cuticularis]
MKSTSKQKVKVSLVSRSFQSRIQGIGTYSKMVYEIIKQNKKIQINLTSQDNSYLLKNNPLGYLFYCLIELPIKIKKSDVYHALSPMEALFLNPNKTIVTIHDLIPIKRAKSLKNKLFKILFNQALKKSIKCEIIAISEETARDLEEYYNVDYETINVIPPAISENFFPTNKNNEIFTIGTISYLENRKRIDILINAFLKADIKNSLLLIGGKGPELENLKKIANNDLRIKFLGFVPDHDMNDFYNSLDVFVFPTIMEGYGLPIVEAMACEKPVITLEDGSIPSDIKDKTFISSKSNLANDLKNRNFKCNLKSNLKFANEHSLDKTGQKLKKIYDSMI